MKLLNFNVCEDKLNSRTKTQTTRQDEKSRFKRGDFAKLIWKGKKEIGVVRIVNITKFNIKRTTCMDFINGEPAFLYKELEEIARKDGFNSGEEYINVIHKIYNILEEKPMHIYQWRWM